jgi:hypothetical protein
MDLTLFIRTKKTPQSRLLIGPAPLFMGAFFSKGKFSGKWLKKKPPLAGEVPNRDGGVFFIPKRALFRKEKNSYSSGAKSNVCTKKT